jgi:hypothetical protein
MVRVRGRVAILVRRCLVSSAVVGLMAGGFVASVSPALASTTRTTVASSTVTWTQHPGCAHDIASGNPPGTIWVVGCNPVPGGYGIYEWNVTHWLPLPGGAASIAAGLASAPWVTNNAGQIYSSGLSGASPRGGGNPWGLESGCAHDISRGFITVSVVSCKAVPGGDAVYQQDLHRGTGWVAQPGVGAVRISENDGADWVINDAGRIYQANGTGWVQLPGCAHDIATDAGGSVWVVGCNAVLGGYGIYELNSTGTGWVPQPGGAVRISANGGQPWVVNDVGDIYSSS